MQAPGSPFTGPYLSPGLVPGSPGDLLSLITFPQTPLQTQMLSWPKPHPGCTPDLDSPAVPCRLSSTSPRWTSACAARSLPKPELALPSPHCQALTQPSALRKGTELGPYPFLSLLPAPQPQAPVGKTKVRVGVGLTGNQGSGGWGSQLPTVWGATSILSVHFICLCGRLAAGWGICLSVCCWCA